jgi:hypothetical protein
MLGKKIGALAMVAASQEFRIPEVPEVRFDSFNLYAIASKTRPNFVSPIFNCATPIRSQQCPKITSTNRLQTRK